MTIFATRLGEQVLAPDQVRDTLSKSFPNQPCMQLEQLKKHWIVGGHEETINGVLYYVGRDRTTGEPVRWVHTKLSEWYAKEL